MNYNLKDYFTSIKLNTHRFEELSFANSSFSMSKKELSQILFAEINNEEQEVLNNATNSEIPNSSIFIKEKEPTLFDKIKKKISDFFKPKPQIKRLTEADFRKGTVFTPEGPTEIPGDRKNPLISLAKTIANTLQNMNQKAKDIKAATTITNEPQIISEHPAVINDKTKTEQDSTLLTAAKEVNPNIVIPGQTGKINTTGSYINSTPKAITVENVHVDKEEILNDNKDKIATLIEESDSKTTNEPKAPTNSTGPAREDNSDDLTL